MQYNITGTLLYRSLNMATITLKQPVTDVPQTVVCAPESQFVFDFPISAAALSKDGDNLVLRFEDGSSIVLLDFYAVYTVDSLPDFVVDGVHTSGNALFASLNRPELLPEQEADPHKPSLIDTGGHYVEYTNLPLEDGIARLPGLDVSFPDKPTDPEKRYGAYMSDDDGIPRSAPVPAGPEPRPAVEPGDPLPPRIPPVTTDPPVRPVTPPVTPPTEPPVISPGTPPVLPPITIVIPPITTDPTPDPKPNQTPGLVVPNVGGASAVVYEADLDGRGSGQGDRETASGTFTADTRGEGGTLTIGSVSIVIDPSGNGRIPPEGVQIVKENVGTLTIKSVVGGVVTYEFTLVQGQEHDKTAGQDGSLTTSFGITLKDASGDEKSGSLVISIVDDQPSITIDGAETFTHPVLSGREIEPQNGVIAISPGADGLKSEGGYTITWTNNLGQTSTVSLNFANGPMTFTGEYGTLTIQEDGTYAYQARPNTTGTDAFKFRVTDTDGDTDAATLNFAVSPVRVLASSTVTTSDAEIGREYAVDVNLPDGTSFDPALLGNIRSDFGVFSVKNGELTFTQTAPYAQHGTQGVETARNVEQFQVPVRGADGTVSSIVVQLNIVDDVPRFTGPFSPPQSTEDTSGTLISGKASLVYGGDTAAPTAPLVARATTPDGTPVDGVFTINPQTGAFTFRPTEPLTDGQALKFIFTATDADGDKATASTSFVYTRPGGPVPPVDPVDPEPPVPAQNASDVKVYEKWLADGSGTTGGGSPQPDESNRAGNTFAVDMKGQAGTITISGPDATPIVLSTTAEGEFDGTFAPLTMETDAGVLTVTGVSVVDGKTVVSYEYELKDAQGHETARGTQTAMGDVFSISATAKSSDSAEIAVLQTTISEAEALETGIQTLSDQIADGRGSAELDALNDQIAALNSQIAQGATSIADTQSAVSTAESGLATLEQARVPLQEQVTALEAQIAAAQPGEDTTALSQSLAAAQAALNTNTDDISTATTTLTELQGQLTSLQDAAAADTQTLSGLTAEKSALEATLGDVLTPEQLAALQTQLDTSRTELAALLDGKTLADLRTELTGLGGADTPPELGANQIRVLVVDDVPTIEAGLASGSPAQVNAGDAVSGTLPFNYGADGKGADNITVNGREGVSTDNGRTLTYDLGPQVGTLIIDTQTQTFTFNTADNAYTHTRNLKFTITDADGDTDTAGVAVGIRGNVPPDPTDPRGVPGVVPGSLVVYEANLPDGSSPAAQGAVASGTLNVSAANGADNVLVIGTGANAITIDLAAPFAGPQSWTTPAGTLTITGTSPAADGGTTVAYTYTLGDNQAHGIPGTGIPGTGTPDTVLTEAVPVSLNGQPAGPITISIVDDIPTIAATGNDNGVTGTVAFDYHADSEGGELWVNGVLGTKSDGDNIVFTLDNGTLNVNTTSNTFFFTPNGEFFGQQELAFTVVDGDKDQITQTVSVTVRPPVVSGAAEVYGYDRDVAENLDGDNVFVRHEVPMGLAQENSSFDLARSPAYEQQPDGTMGVSAFISGEKVGYLSTGEDGLLYFTQTAVYSHGGKGQDTAYAVSMADIPLIDAYGNFGSATVQINIVDAVPIIKAHMDSENPAAPGTAVTGHVDFDYGADGRGNTGTITVNGVRGTELPAGGADGQPAMSFDLPGGTLVLAPATGSFVFTPHADTFGPQTFDFRITDADGDMAASTVTASFTQNISAETVVNSSDGLVGTDGAKQVIELPPGVKVDIERFTPFEVVQKDAAGNPVPDAEGHPQVIGIINVDAQGKLYFEQSASYDHGTPGGASDQSVSFTTGIPIIKDGFTGTLGVTVNISDTVPTIVATKSDEPGFSGALDINYNADGKHTDALLVNGVKGTPDGDKLVFSITEIVNNVQVIVGSVTVNPDNSFTFTPAEGVNGRPVDLSFTVVDSDGDTAVSGVTFIVPVSAAGRTESFDTEAGTDVPSAVAGTAGLILSGDQLVRQGDVVIGKFTTSPDGSIVFVQDAAYTHEPGTQTAQFQQLVDVVNRDGIPGKVLVDIAINDDAPVIQNVQDVRIHAGEPDAEGMARVSGTFTIASGADGFTENGLTFSFDNTPLASTGVNTWQGQDGNGNTITVIKAEGTNEYTYEYEYNSSTQKDNFSGTLRMSATDSDQDSTAASLNIIIENRPPDPDPNYYLISKDTIPATVNTATLEATIESSKAVITVNNASDYLNPLSYNGYTGIQAGTALAANDFFDKFFNATGDDKPLSLEIIKGQETTGVISIIATKGIAAIQAAAETALQEGKLLLIKGTLDIPAEEHLTLGVPTIVDGFLTVQGNGSFTANSFVYVAGDVKLAGDATHPATLAVNGGMAIQGALDSVNLPEFNTVTPAHAADSLPIFVAEGVEVVVGESAPAIEMPEGAVTFTFGDLLQNDMDPDDGAPSPAHSEDVKIVNISLQTQDGATVNISASGGDGTYAVDGGTITVNWAAGTITAVSPIGQATPMDLKYTVEDSHGAQAETTATVGIVTSGVGASEYSNILEGGTSPVLAGGKYNIAVTLDSSGSMQNMETAVSAVKNYLTALNTQAQDTGSTVNVLFTDFDSMVNKTIKFGLPASLEAMNSLLADIVAPKGGGTNYEAAFNAMTKWFTAQDASGKGMDDGYINKSIFITDGKPTFAFKDSLTITSGGASLTLDPAELVLGQQFVVGGVTWTVSATNGRAAMRAPGFDPINLNLGNGQETAENLSNSKAPSLLGLEALKAVSPDIDAIGIGLNSSDLWDYDPSPIIINDAFGLEAALHQVAVNSAKPDVIYANQGADLLFGDAARLISDSGAELTLAQYVAEKIGAERADSAQSMAYVQNNAEEISDRLVFSPSDQSDALVGGGGNDLLYGQGGKDILVGDGTDVAGPNDTLSQLKSAVGLSNTASNLQTATAVHDAVVSGNQPVLDTLASQAEGSTSDGSDWLFGGEGDDVLFGMGGNDKLTGGAGNDVLFGGAGNDAISGGGGNDVIYGGTGDDAINGGTGNNVIHGGAGNDLISYSLYDSLVDGGEGMDILVGPGATNAASGTAVTGVEVFIDTNRTDITSSDELAEKLGITINNDGNRQTVAFEGWALGPSQQEGYVTLVRDDATAMVKESDLDAAYAEKIRMETNNG